ncbi:protein OVEREXPRESSOR OF CATIONIC PEROXIDASE 3 isoform X3 [Cajanus cajan]|uniref:protein OVEREXPRESSOR OF CATIONIC PEROXIDASE 3 isoform X2 n=1 Tax=Cajanus cajan TaxID=3821 RepID=UPI0010FBADE7|nr:protein OVEREXPRESSOR OF CATIONIC PEROXIDASE 3 isoform X2 [Cajanus cajan]XP_029126731.1 protein OVEREXPRESSOR OF CATIONIC PEROXIDASE 3 isoform X3 [Cajanus cajan]
MKTLTLVSGHSYTLWINRNRKKRKMAVAFRCLSCARSDPFLTLPFQRKPLFCSVPLPSRARNLCSSIVAASSKKKNKKKLSPHHVTEVDDEDEDAFELLFKQLEEDLKRDGLSEDEDEITEEDMALLERELENALGDFDAELLNSDVIDIETGSDPEEEEEEEDDDDDDGDNDDNDKDDGDEKSLKLRNWQMKKLARALKAGRRKTSIKNLAADLCLDRALVLQLLREPPPNLLMMSLSIPDEPTTTVVSLETKPREIVHIETSVDHAESGPKAKVPVHTLQRNWYAQKRLKKAHVDTLERVYRRSKRPTNAMISSIVHVTNIPRKRVVKWFEDKRAEEGVPDRRLPYQRSVPETA